ncbi:MAG: hypothetical protein HFP77_06295 [Methylococcales symbiont of Iophon sp. n. MRB-2018]|nr:MAG: hypothetical protein HFP77_06295 [Methylococcales symbiont of Iophon sp. n. MRB-2018]KAF3978978.1 MAG: hypothetical protein HFP76_09620 [Methylococcales symbiont of Iophon sp. n. MRB-2018]
MNKNLIQEAIKMPANERVALAESLLDSVYPEPKSKLKHFIQQQNNEQQHFMRDIVVGLIDIKQGDTQSLESVKKQFGL